MIIPREKSFRFKAGDYIFIKIPAIATNEFHPFTVIYFKNIFFLSLLASLICIIFSIETDKLSPGAKRRNMAARAQSGQLDEQAKRVLLEIF